MEVPLRLAVSVVIGLALSVISTASVANSQPPNVLVLLVDDLGIGDIGCYGNDTIRTPNIDRLAAEGVKLTHHLAAAPLCTPSRAAMMTGRYPARYGLVANKTFEFPVIPHVSSKIGLPLDEVTLATALRAANYTTAIVGKWHLGMYCSLFGLSCPGPLNHGFQTFYGIPTSLFMEYRGPHTFWKFSLENAKYQNLTAAWVISIIILIMTAKICKLRLIVLIFLLLFAHLIIFVAWFFIAHVGFGLGTTWGVSPWLHRFANSMLYRQDQVVEKPIELDGLAQRLVAESRQFLADHANDDKPFFLYHSFAHVHTPMFTADERSGFSKHGRYGDNIEEMDETLGILLDSLKEFGLEENTIVYFTSDHGGHLEAIDDEGQRIGGHNGLFKGSKCQGGTEGGIRVAGIYRWEGHLPKGASVHTPTSHLDLMPTILELAHLPKLEELVPRAVNKELDGISIAKLLKEGDVTPPEERIMIHHCKQAVHAVRLTRGKHVYKMHVGKVLWYEGSTQCGWGHSICCLCYDDKHWRDISHAPELYDLSIDPFEDKPIDQSTDEYKEIVEFLQQYLKEWRSSVYYPPPTMSERGDVLWRPLYQPLCLRC